MNTKKAYYYYFFLFYKDQKHRKNILQRFGQLLCSVKEKTLSSCFHTKSFDNKKEYGGKIIPKKEVLHIVWQLAVRDIRKQLTIFRFGLKFRCLYLNYMLKIKIILK